MTSRDASSTQNALLAQFDAPADTPEEIERERQQVEDTLAEYAGSLEPAAAEAFRARLGSDASFHDALSKTLTEMALLIAGAAVLPDEAAFNRLRRRVLFESRQDIPEAHAMRLHYLENYDAVELDNIIGDDDERGQFDERMAQFLQDYREQRAFQDPAAEA